MATPLRSMHFLPYIWLCLWLSDLHFWGMPFCIFTSKKLRMKKESTESFKLKEKIFCIEGNDWNIANEKSVGCTSKLVFIYNNIWQPWCDAQKSMISFGVYRWVLLNPNKPYQAQILWLSKFQIKHAVQHMREDFELAIISVYHVWIKQDPAAMRCVCQHLMSRQTDRRHSCLFFTTRSFQHKMHNRSLFSIKIGPLPSFRSELQYSPWPLDLMTSWVKSWIHA